MVKYKAHKISRIYSIHFRISTDMTREFCHHCGNQTLRRVSMTVEEDGSIKYFLSTKKPMSTRGMKVKYVPILKAKKAGY